MKWLYLIPTLLFFLLVPNFVDGVESPRLILLIIFAFLLLIAAPNILAVGNKFLFLPFILPILMIFSAFFNEQNLLNAFFGKQGRNFGILLYLSLASIFLASAKIKIRDSKEFFSYCLVPLIFFSIGYGLIQITGNDFLNWGEKDRIVLTVGNSNFAAGYLAMLIPACLYGIFIQRSLAKKLLFIFLSVAVCYLGIKTISSQFYVLAAIAILSFMFIYKMERIAVIPKLLKISLLFGSTLISSTMIYVNRNVIDELTNAADRLAQQKAGLSIFWDHVLFGVGPDNLNRFMPQYLTASDIRREGYYNNPDRTHNTFVDILANIGLFAGIAYSIFIVFIFYMIYRVIESKKIAKLEIALPASIFITYVFQGFINTDSILNMIMPYICMGVIASLYQQPDNKEISFTFHQRNGIRTILAVGIISFLFVVPKLIQSEFDTKRILSTGKTSAQDLLRVVNLWPDRGNIERILVPLSQNLANCPLTVRVADRLIEVDDRSSQGWYVKALCVDSTGNQKTARDFVNLALKFQPLNPTYLSGIIQLENALGLEEESRRHSETLDSMNLKEFEP